MQSSLLTTVLLPLALALVMLGMGLTLMPADFLRIWRRPRALTLGLLTQMAVLPLLAVTALLQLAFVWPGDAANGRRLMRRRDPIEPTRRT